MGKTIRTYYERRETNQTGTKGGPWVIGEGKEERNYEWGRARANSSQKKDRK